jgi:Domain of unknown function (DUF4331)
MSHHLDSPIARQDIRLDITDLYVFRGETGTAFVINACHFIGGPLVAPGDHPGGMYEFKIDLDGDAVEDVTYQITFDERDAAGQQRFVLRCIRGAGAVDFQTQPALSSPKGRRTRRSPRAAGCGLPMIHPLFTQYYLKTLSCWLHRFPFSCHLYEARGSTFRSREWTNGPDTWADLAFQQRKK